MKKFSKKVISVIVCVLLIASSLSCVMGIFASAETPTATAGKNLLKGLIPITFTCSEVGNNHYNWQEIATYIPSDPNGAKWEFGYDLRNGQNLPLKEDYWKPFTATLTDGSTDTKQWLQSMNSGKDFIITYELADASIIEGFFLWNPRNQRPSL